MRSFTMRAGFKLWRPFHLELGPLHFEAGGMGVKKGPVWVPDGLHVWWNDRWLSVWWHKGLVGSKRIDYGRLPTIPEPPASERQDRP